MSKKKKPVVQYPKMTMVEGPKKKLKAKEIAAINKKNLLLRSRAIWMLIFAVVISVCCQVILKSVGIPFIGSVYEVIVYLIVFLLESRALYIFSVIYREEKPGVAKKLRLLFFSQGVIFIIILIVKIIRLVQTLKT